MEGVVGRAQASSVDDPNFRYILLLMIFAWDDRNVAHIGKHGVTPPEAEFIVRHARSPFPESSRDGKFRAWGQTQEGRYLQVVFVYPDDEDVDIESLDPLDRLVFADGLEIVVYVIHARDLEESEKKQFRRRRTQP
jgi:uncharacterized DUF497 family protein